jgi:hypothetical protein
MFMAQISASERTRTWRRAAGAISSLPKIMTFGKDCFVASIDVLRPQACEWLQAGGELDAHLMVSLTL